MIKVTNGGRMAGGKPEKTRLKPYIFGASVLKKDDREIREIEIFLHRITPHPCFVGLFPG